MKALRMKANEVSNMPTADLIRMCINDAAQGVKVDQIRARIRVLDAMEKVGEGDMLLLEDSDAKTLQGCVAGMVWTKVRPDIVAFCDAVAGMTEPPAAPVEARAAAK